MIDRLRFLRVPVLVLMLLALIPAAVSAQDTGNGDSFVLQMNRSVTVAPEDTYEALMVVEGNVTVEGLVTDTLIVVNGDAVVNGEIPGDIVMVSGTLTLGPEAAVGNINLFRGDLVRDAGATVTGEVSSQDSFGGIMFGLSIVSILFWVGVFIMTVLAGLAFVAFAGRFMTRATESILHQPLETGVTGLATWIVLPIVTVVAFVSLIGIPVGFALMVVVIPLLALMGYLVAAYLVGTWLAAAAKIDAGRYLSVFAGIVVLQLLGLVPWIGGLFVFIATMFGTGALVWRFWHDRREPRASATPVAPIGGAAHA